MRMISFQIAFCEVVIFVYKGVPSYCMKACVCEQKNLFYLKRLSNGQRTTYFSTILSFLKRWMRSGWLLMSLQFSTTLKLVSCFQIEDGYNFGSKLKRTKYSCKDFSVVGNIVLARKTFIHFGISHATLPGSIVPERTTCLTPKWYFNFLSLMSASIIQLKTSRELIAGLISCSADIINS